MTIQSHLNPGSNLFPFFTFLKYVYMEAQKRESGLQTKYIFNYYWSVYFQKYIFGGEYFNITKSLLFQFSRVWRFLESWTRETIHNYVVDDVFFFYFLKYFFTHFQEMLAQYCSLCIWYKPLPLKYNFLFISGAWKLGIIVWTTSGCVPIICVFLMWSIAMAKWIVMTTQMNITVVSFSSSLLFLIFAFHLKYSFPPFLLYTMEYENYSHKSTFRHIFQDSLLKQYISTNTHCFIY